MTHPVRIKPRPSLAWAIGLLYGPAFIALLLASGIDYDNVPDSTHNLILHAWNLVAGQSVPATAFQLVTTFVLGSILYAVRRTTGTLVIPIVLHAGWDWASFTGASDAFENAADLVDPRAPIFTNVGIAVMVVLFLVGAKQLLPPTTTARPS